MSGSLRDEIAMAICLVGCGIAAHRSDYFGEADAALATLRTWLAENGMVVVPVCCTAAMSDATAQYRAEMERCGRPIHPDDMWAMMLAAAPATGLEGE
jgi:hypothetical protein